MPILVYPLLAISVLGSLAQAQPELPIVRANSPVVRIMDGDKPMKGEWTLDPSIELDVYNAIRTGKSKTVTFTTGIDSRSFVVEPRMVYAFVILLNGTYACRTRLSTMTQGYERADPGSTGSLTIPITLGRGKLHLRGRINGSQALDLIFDTGADTCVVYSARVLLGHTVTWCINSVCHI